jgi:hypothetical protein
LSFRWRRARLPVTVPRENAFTRTDARRRAGLGPVPRPFVRHDQPIFAQAHSSPADRAETGNDARPADVDGDASCEDLSARARARAELRRDRVRRRAPLVGRQLLRADGESGSSPSSALCRSRRECSTHPLRTSPHARPGRRERSRSARGRGRARSSASRMIQDLLAEPQLATFMRQPASACPACLEVRKRKPGLPDP